MNFIACILLLSAISFLICCYILNIKMTKKIIITSLCVISGSIIILGLNQLPPQSFDLYRYFLELEYIRTLNFEETMSIIFANVNLVWATFESIVAFVSENNNIIFLFSVPLTIIPYIYILLNSKKDYNLTNRQVVISIFSYFALVNITHIMSGIRNALAISIFSLGMYLELFKNKKIGYIYYLISLLIHPMVIIFLAFRILVKFIYKIKFEIKIGHFLVLFWSAFSKIILYILKICVSLLPFSMLVLYVEKLNTELSITIAIDYRIVIPELIQIIIFTIWIYKIIKKQKDFDKIMFIFYYLCFFVIGSVHMPTMFTRTRFIFAYFLPFILGYSNILPLEDDEKNKNKILEHCMMIISIYINVYYIYYMCCNSAFI